MRFELLIEYAVDHQMSPVELPAVVNAANRLDVPKQLRCSTLTFRVRCVALPVEREPRGVAGATLATLVCPWAISGRPALPCRIAVIIIELPSPTAEAKD